MIGKKFVLAVFCIAFSLLCGAEIPFAERMEGIVPDVQQHLLKVLAEFPRTETGKTVLSHVSSDVQFRTRAMAQLGTADNHNVVTLEALRLENKSFPATTERQIRIKTCFTAEILAHELLHNGQMNAGLFQYPANFTGFGAVLCERLLELQAKFTGESMFYQMRELPDYQEFVAPKAGFFLVMQRQSKDAAREYALTLWQDRFVSPGGVKLYREQIREVSQWNTYYAEQAFRNNYLRFLNDSGSCSDAEIAAHLDKIIAFTHMPLTGAELLQTSPVRPIPHGIELYENGKKALEIVAVEGGYVKRIFSGNAVREVKVPVNFAR